MSHIADSKLNTGLAVAETWHLKGQVLRVNIR